MNKIIQSLVVFAFTLTLGACGSSSNNKGNSGGNPGDGLAIHTETELTSDLQNLNATEKSLEGVGLKVESNFDYQNGLSTTTYKWDKVFLTKFFDSHPSATFNNMIPGLETFVTVANAYLKKYSEPFNLKKEDGTLEPSSLKPALKKELEAKIDLANQTITSAKKQ